MLTCLGVPQPHRLVPTSAGNRLAIWTKRYAQDKIPMASERPLLFTRNSIPQQHDAGVPPTTGNRDAIRAERYASDRIACIAGERPLPLPRLGIPQP